MVIGQLKLAKRLLGDVLCESNPTPTFVLGNQKTGTTAISGLLAEYAGIGVTLDLPGLYEPTQTQIHKGQLSLRDFVKQNRYEFSKELIKKPCLTFLYSELKETFPEAQFLFIIRDPRDNIRTILDRVSLPGDRSKLSGDQKQKLSPEWRLILFGDWLGLDGTNYIEYLASRWKEAARIYSNNEESFRLVRYEDFLDDKLGVISQIATDLGYSNENDIEDLVDKQFQPRGNRDVSWDEFFGEKNLRYLEQVCAEEMKKFGYEALG